MSSVSKPMKKYQRSRMFGGCLDYHGRHKRHIVEPNTGQNEEAVQKKKQAIRVKEEFKHSTKTATCAKATKGATQKIITAPTVVTVDDFCAQYHKQNRKSNHWQVQKPRWLPQMQEIA